MARDSRRESDNNANTRVNVNAIITDVLTKNMDANPTNACPSTPKHGGRLLKPTGTAINYYTPGATPAACKIWFLPVIGSTDDMNKATTLSQVASNIWNSLRTYCTTAQNYQPGDVLQAFIQLAQFPMALARIKRQLCSLYCQAERKNFYKNDFWKMFIDTQTTKEDEIAKIDKNIKTYNSIVRQFNEICMPDMFPIFHRWEAMLTKVFRDIEDDDVAQLYFFDTTTFYVTHLADPETVPGAEMVPKSMAGSIETNLYQLQEWMQTLYDDASIRDIVADVSETYSDKTFYKVPILTYDDIKDGIQTEYNVDVLFAIYNATLAPVVPPTVNIVPNSGGIMGKYIPGTVDGSTLFNNGILNIFRMPKLFNAQEWNTPVDRFIKSTVWTISEPTANANNGLQTVVGEILTSADIYCYSYPTGAAHASWDILEDVYNFVNPTVAQGYEANALYSLNDLRSLFEKMGKLATFAWAPMFYLLSGHNDGNSLVDGQIDGVLAELEHPVFLDPDDLESWHDTARMGLWGLPIGIEPKSRM